MNDGMGEKVKVELGLKYLESAVSDSTFDFP